MGQNIFIIFGLFFLAVFSGMAGLGVAFAAIPFLSIFLSDLLNQVQPLTLLLNGLTAMLAAFGFAYGGYLELRKAMILALFTTAGAPVGAYLVHFVDARFVWYVYLLAVIYILYRIFVPTKTPTSKENLKMACLMAIPISIVSGFVGIGPGFLLVPTLILFGFSIKKAAAMNAFAATPYSFVAFSTHLPTATIDMNLTIPLLLVGGLGAFMGARLSSSYVSNEKLTKNFGILVLVMTTYKISTFFGW